MDSGYLGLTLSFSENFTCWSFRWKTGVSDVYSWKLLCKVKYRKKISYRWNEIAWLVLHKAGIYGLSWIHLMTIAFKNSFQDLNKEI